MVRRRAVVSLVALIALLPNGMSTTVMTSNGDEDVAPPVVILTMPAKGITTRKAEIVVKGRVSDDSSGIASVTCNGRPATVVDGDVRCLVSLRPGINDVVLQASDVAGNSASAGGRITRVLRNINAIALTPGRRTMLVNESATLTLRDDASAEVTEARWTSSDSDIVTLSADDPPVLKAIRPGSATITAEIGGLTAEAIIGVVAGTELPAGTARWSVPPTPGMTMEPPIFANRVDQSGPDLFIVETETWGEATLRAVDADGNVLWQQHSPGLPLMGDSFGGVIAGVLYDVNQGEDLQAYVRLGVSGGVAPWRYQSPGSLLRPAQAPDGTLYALEFMHGGVDAAGEDIWDKHAIVIDGKTGGLISRLPLAREVEAFESANDGVKLNPKLTCRSTRAEYAPQTVGPIVGSDGRGYLLVRRRIKLGKGICNEFNGANYVPARTQDVGVELIALSPRNAAEVQSLYTLQCVSVELQRTSCDVPPLISQLLPDGIGGVLASWWRALRLANRYSGQSYMTRIDAAGAGVDTPVPSSFWIDLIGQAGTAYVRAPGEYRLVDMTSFATNGTLILQGGLVAARPDGGVAAIDDAGDLHVLAPTGGEEEVIPLGLSLTSAAPAFDGWIGLSNAGLTSVAGEFQDATRWTVGVGNGPRQLAVRRPGMGIFLKSQDAVFANTVAQHNSIRVVPVNQEWLASQSALQLPADLDATDAFGNRYFTLGAGLPDGNDTTPACGGGNLTKGINREGDVTKPVKALRKLPVGHEGEGAAVFSLLSHFNNYGNDLPYWCLPGDPDSTAGLAYNSNSFAHGLLHAAGVAHDEREPRWPAPGWSLPVPEKYFKHAKKPRKAK